jgi:hypothetical protein
MLLMTSDLGCRWHIEGNETNYFDEHKEGRNQYCKSRKTIRVQLY